MTNLERKVDLLIDLLTAEDESTRTRALEDLKSIKSKAPSRALDSRSAIEACMLELGFSAHLLGYAYTMDAVSLVMEDASLGQQFWDRVYPAVAALHDTTVQRVERAMRHAIESAWTYVDDEVVYHYFGNSIHADRDRPTNSRFVCQLARYVTRQLNP